MTLSDQPLRLGLIGAGPWGRNYINAIKEMAGFRLARLASQNKESRLLAPRDCAIATDWREVAKAIDLDGVIIATPPFTHAGITAVSILAGIPVLVEKPLTLDLKQAKDLLSLTKANRGLVMVDHIHLFSPSWSILKQKSQSLGAVRKIISKAGRFGPFRKDVSVLWDWGAHDIAMCCDLLGRPPTAIRAAIVESRQTEGGLGETVKLEADFGLGVSAEIVLSNLFDRHHRYFSVYFDDCALVYDGESLNKLTLHSLGDEPGGELGKAWPLVTSGMEKKGNLLRLALAAFGQAILEKSKDTGSLRLGVRVVETLARAEQMLCKA